MSRFLKRVCRHSKKEKTEEINFFIALFRIIKNTAFFIFRNIKLQFAFLCKTKAVEIKFFYLIFGMETAKHAQKKNESSVSFYISLDMF